MKYIKKPVEIEAYQITKSMVQDERDNKITLPKGLSFSSSSSFDGKVESWFGRVTTIHGQQTKVTIGDWIITEPDGVHFYPCKPDIFAATYDKVLQQSTGKPRKLTPRKAVGKYHRGRT